MRFVTIRKYGLTLALGILCVGSAKATQTTTAAPTPPMRITSAAASVGSGLKTPAVAISTAPIPEPSISDLYPLDKMHLRDPFMQMGGSSGGYGEQGETTEFSIHSLVLKGIMQDSSGDFALFVDAASGANYVLRKD